MSTNRTVSAEEALAIGLVSKVTDDAGFDEALQTAAVKMAAVPSGAAQALKRLLHAGELESLEAHLEDEAKTIAALAAHPDTLEKLEAFFNR